MWIDLPPKPALIIPPEKPAIIRPATPNLRPPSILGLTMMARTWGLRIPIAAAGLAGISLVGVFENSSNGTSTTVAISGAAAGDVSYAFQAGAAIDEYPSGYTVLASVLIYTPFVSAYLNVSRKILTGADTSAVFPATQAGYFGSACGIALLRGVNNTTPEDATTTTISLQTSGQPNGPAITTVTANAWVISAFGAVVDGDGSYTEPSTYGNKIDVFGDGVIDSGLGVAMINGGAAGSKDPGAWSDVTFGSPANWAAATVAVRPA